MLVAAGILLGAVGWALSHLLSGQFEPFDSDTGFLTIQALLAFPAFAFGLKRGLLAACGFVLGGYLGLNGYAYLAGSAETRAWALLGAMTSVTLVVLPAMAGVVGSVAGRRQRSE